MPPRTISFVTTNVVKLDQVRAILGANSLIEIVTHELELPEIQGEIEEICIKKCLEAARVLKGPVLVEDTSLCYNALKGLPGPYIKWFVYKLGPEGLANLLTGWEDKSAKAISTFAYCGDCKNVKVFQGVVHGQIVSPRGPRKVGFDAIFQPNGLCKTYGELTTAERYKVSHRTKAIEKIKEYFRINR